LIFIPESGFIFFVRHFRLSLLAPPEAKHNEVQHKTPPAWLRHALNPGRRKFTETRRVKLTPTLKKNTT
jgi:hypothetical protein